MPYRPLSIIIALVAIVLAALFADYREFLGKSVIAQGTELEYEIKSGTAFAQLARDLQARGIIHKPIYWRLWAKGQHKADKVKAGLYHIKGPVTPRELLDHFIAGKTVQFSLTIPEGWTFRQILAAVQTHPQIVRTLKPEDDIMALLGSPGTHPEGWFFPDTYWFPKGSTDLEFLRRSHDAMKARLQAEWESKAQALPVKTPYEALILASIVEKETAVAEERPFIAAVFVSRLEKGMLLQTDPTVIYGLGEDYTGDIRYRDLRRDTPYNTYIHKGLPPTPIAAPSGDALRAVLQPADTQALFFVAKGDGRHHFSQTYREHRQAVMKYQMNGNAKRYKARN